MPDLERYALDQCRGQGLDIGCGAGSHALWVQDGGFSCTGMDLSRGAVKVCRARGLERVLLGDIWETDPGGYDTILLMMNGLGLAGDSTRLTHFIGKMLNLLKPGGQILAESTDLEYLFDLVPGLDQRTGFDKSYYGNLVYTFEYRGKKGRPFPWLFAGEELIEYATAEAGGVLEILGRNTESGFLLRIAKSNIG
jgi:SAM-dependent methyltransferase